MNSQLPQGWRMRTLGEVADTALGKMLDRGRPQGGTPVPYLRNANVQWGAVSTSDVQHMELALDEQARFRVDPGDLLVCEGGEIGRAAVWGGSSQYMSYQKALHRVRVGPEVLAQYLRYLLEHYSHSGVLTAHATGSTIRHLPQQQLRRLPVPLPDVSEQRHILDLLEEHLSRIDVAERYLRDVFSKGQAARGAVLQAALQQTGNSRSGAVAALVAERARRCPAAMKRGRPEAVPAAAVDVPWDATWATVSLEEATDPVRTISYGILKPGPNLATGVPYVRVLNMRHDVLAVNDLHRTSSEIALQYSRATLAPGDVLVSIRGTYGRVVLVPTELAGANITQDTARLALLPQLRPDFVALVLRSPWAQQHLRRVARGVGVKGVNITDLREMPMPLPSLEEQAQLVAQVDTLTSDLAAANRAASAGLRRATSLRRSLLAAAFSGRLADVTTSKGTYV